MPRTKQPTDQPPHTYKAQRQAEREAAAARERLLRLGKCETKPVCGYTYLTRKSKRFPDNPRVMQVCARVAGAGTKHFGSGFCDYHEWQEAHNPTNQLGNALKQAAEQAFFFGKPIPTDPVTALLEEVSRTAAVVDWVHEKLNEFRAMGMSDADIMTQRTLQAGIQPSVWYNLYQQERSHLVDVCTRAIKAGIAERKVQIAERQGQLIASMMFAFIHDKELGLSVDQITNAPRIIRKHLLQLPMAADAEQKIDPEGIMRAHAIETTAMERQ